MLDLSFLTINSMISLSPPGVSSLIQEVMIKYLYFDILYCELWIDEFLTSIGLNLDEVKNDSAISVEFDNNGF